MVSKKWCLNNGKTNKHTEKMVWNMVNFDFIMDKDIFVFLLKNTEISSKPVNLGMEVCLYKDHNREN